MPQRKTAIERVERAIFDSSPLSFCTWLTVLIVARTGILWPLDHADKLALDPFAQISSDPDVQYLTSSWLQPYLAWLLGLNEGPRYFLFTLAISVATGALVFIHFFRKFDDESARKAGLIFAVLPVSGIVYYRLALDGATVLLLVCAYLARRRLPWVLVLGVLLGMQHFEQGACAAAILGGALLVDSYRKQSLERGLGFPAALLVGLVVGKLALSVIFNAHGMVIADRADFVARHLTEMPREIFLGLPISLWSGLGLGWLLLPRFHADADRRAGFYTALALCLPLLLVTLDTTRVMAILMLLPILHYWFADDALVRRISRREAAILGIVWLVTPWVYTIKGATYTSALPRNILDWAALMAR
jgi:hypothetical protein